MLQYVVVEILLDHGADIEAKTRNGETALGTYLLSLRAAAFLMHFLFLIFQSNFK